jgi:hypothetical protein
MSFFLKDGALDANPEPLHSCKSRFQRPGRTNRPRLLKIAGRWVRSHAAVLLAAVLVLPPLFADSILLGDISLQPDTPITGLDSIFLDNFTDLPDLGCSTTFPACSGLDISGTLSVMYLDSLGNSQDALVDVGPTGPGSTSIYEFDPTQITFESAVLTGSISPSTFLLGDGTTFVSTGSFTSDTLTPDVGFGEISVKSGGATVPEPALSGFAIQLMTFIAIVLRRRLTRGPEQTS